MAVSLYDVSVGTFQQILGSVANFLEKGLAHCRDKNIDPNEFVEARLHPDMAPLRFQIVSVAHHSAGAIDALKSGEFRPPSGMGSLDYPALQALVIDARAKLKAVAPSDVDDAAGRDVTFRLGDRTIPFTAEGFLLSFSLPNFYFHATTAYDILRSKGVAIGKRDYLGQMKLKS